MAIKTKTNGGMVIARSAVPMGRVYPDRYAELWSEVAKLKTTKGYAINPNHYASSINALRCGLRRCKRQGRVPQDIRVRFDGTLAYFYRG